MTERVRVAARIRPLPTPESLLAVASLDERRVCVANRRVYSLDRVFGSDVSTEQIFYESVVSLVDQFLAGYNATILAYGQTGTGKTYTMEGLTPLVVHYIVENMSNSTSKLSFQYVEVYGETLRDLLSSDPVGSTKHLQLHERESGGGGMAVVVVGASRVRARNIAEVEDIINYGARMRTTGSTNIHEHSSRSHSIFTIFNDEQQSKMNLVDLAGSERNKKTHNVGLRFRESIAINGGLLALGNVIRALSRNHFQTPEHPRHVPYRGSKLTRLLQDSLGGNSSTLLIACVASDAANSDETTRTFQYSSLAMHILNEPLPQFDEQVMAAAAAAAAAEAGRNSSGISYNESSTGNDGHDTSAGSEHEVKRLRRRVAVLEGKLQRCREELKNDKAVFGQQIRDMQLLLSENDELKRRVAFLEGRPTTRLQTTPDMKNVIGKHPQEQQRRWDSELASPNGNYVRDTLQLYGIPPRENYNSNNGHNIFHCPSSPPHQAIEKEEMAVRNNAGLLQHQQQEEHQSHRLNKPVDAPRLEGAAAVMAAGGWNHNKTNRDDDSQPLAVGMEEQLGLLAKEALYYQKSNSELRRRLRAVLAVYEQQQRETDMLRLEVRQIHELLDGTFHS